MSRKKKPKRCKTSDPKSRSSLYHKLYAAARTAAHKEKQRLPTSASNSNRRTTKDLSGGLMASKLRALQSKACQATQLVSKHGSTYYKQLLEENKQYIQHPPTVEKCNELSKQLFYTRLASIPGRVESFWKEVDYVKHLWKNRSELKVEDAGIAALFGLECYAWYCAGEIVGRGFTFTGYYV